MLEQSEESIVFGCWLCYLTVWERAPGTAVKMGQRDYAHVASRTLGVVFGLLVVVPTSCSLVLHSSGHVLAWAAWGVFACLYLTFLLVPHRWATKTNARYCLVESGLVLAALPMITFLTVLALLPPTIALRFSMDRARMRRRIRHQAGVL